MLSNGSQRLLFEILLGGRRLFRLLSGQLLQYLMFCFRLNLQTHSLVQALIILVLELHIIHILLTHVLTPINNVSELLQLLDLLNLLAILQKHTPVCDIEKLIRVDP